MADIFTFFGCLLTAGLIVVGVSLFFAFIIDPCEWYIPAWLISTLIAIAILALVIFDRIMEVA